MELQAGKIVAHEEDIFATTSGSSQSRIANEVLTLVNSMLGVAEAILNVQSTVNQTTVRTPVSTHYHFTHPLLGDGSDSTPPLQQVSVRFCSWQTDRLFCVTSCG